MLKGYKEYRETNYDWLPQIPSHWEEKTIRSITKLSDKRCGSRKDLELLSVYREYGVIEKKTRNDNHNVESEDLSNYKYVKKGDLVLNKMKMWQGSLGISDYDGIVSPAYIVCNLFTNANLRYLHFLLRSPLFKTFYNQVSYGIRVGQWDMHYDDFKSLCLYLPPRVEQDQIVRYLDWKVSMINKYINAKKKQIELLKEQKQAIINQTVTKGLNPKAPMRDSGIEWLGKIPKHWEVRRLQTLGVARNGITFEPKDLSDYGTLVLRSSNIKNNQLVFDDNIYVKMPIKDNLILQENDLLICSRNGSRELIGKCALIDKQTAGQTYGAFMCLFRSIYNEYIYYVFQSNILKFYIGTFTTSTINQLTNSNLYSITIPFPTDNERKEVIIFLREQCLIYDNLMNKYNSELILMQEYRTRLISDVITGRVNVQGIKVPEFEIENELSAGIGQKPEGDAIDE